MKRNVGTFDKVIRIIVALIVIVLIVMGVVKGTLAIILAALGAIFIITSLLGFFGLYTLFGISTCPKKSEK